MKTQLFLLVTCEHASNAVPAHLRKLFPQSRILRTHRAWDMGASEIAHAWAERWGAPLFCGTQTRLLIDLNRATENPAVWSVSTKLSEDDRHELLIQHVQYRQAVRLAVAQAVKSGKTVLHLAVHSFTPELDGVVRPMDIGLLYDPTRPQILCPRSVHDAAEAENLAENTKFCSQELEEKKTEKISRAHKKRANSSIAISEKDLAVAWQKHLAGWKVRRNAPYQGKSDGLPSSLRRMFSRYLGFEVEFNQRLQGKQLLELAGFCADGLEAALKDLCLTE